MPEADGTEVAAQLEADWMLHGVPIVFVTALITPEEARDARRIEGHRVVPKPINSSELIKVVEEASHAALLRKQSSFLFGANASGSGTDLFTQPGMCSLIR